MEKNVEKKYYAIKSTKLKESNEKVETVNM